MSRRGACVLGLMWGFAGGVAFMGSVVYAEARARSARRPPTPARVVTLTGRKPL